MRSVKNQGENELLQEVRLNFIRFRINIRERGAR